MCWSFASASAAICAITRFSSRFSSCRAEALLIVRALYYKISLLRSGYRLKMQWLMRWMTPNIKTVEQPVELLCAQRDGVSTQLSRPAEAMLLQALVTEHEPVLPPRQNLDPIALAVGKHVNRLAERIECEGLLNNQRQP